MAFCVCPCVFGVCISVVWMFVLLCMCAFLFVRVSKYDQASSKTRTLDNCFSLVGPGSKVLS